MAVLDTMIEPRNGQPGSYTVYYDILDGDRDGRAPNCRFFNGAKKSCIYKIAKSDNKVAFKVKYYNAYVAYI